MDLQKIDEFTVSSNGFLACRSTYHDDRFCHVNCKVFDGEGLPRSVREFDHRNLEAFMKERKAVKEWKDINFVTVKASREMHLVGVANLFQDAMGLSCSVFEKTYDHGFDLVVLECIGN